MPQDGLNYHPSNMMSEYEGVVKTTEECHKEER